MVMPPIQFLVAKAGGWFERSERGEGNELLD